MALLIRPAAEDDAAALAAIYRPYVEDSRISFEEIAPDPAEMARRIAGEMPGYHPWLVAEEDGHLLGYAASSPFRARAAYRWVVETGIYLAEEAKGRGIGRALLAPLVELLERQGYVAAIGAIALPNDSSVALHERLGFIHSGTYRRVGFKAGEWLDVGLWQKDLAPRADDPVEPKPFEGLFSPG
ncbi:MAG TPA: GNAT family N-acetyltransferase [Sphingomicrobium sp.]|nr:GNAT family N-acetyltransferase [Sphingomicrobium sp.]